jgi:hypothetical protein
VAAAFISPVRGTTHIASFRLATSSCCRRAWTCGATRWSRRWRRVFRRL